MAFGSLMLVWQAPRSSDSTSQYIDETDLNEGVKVNKHGS